MITVLQAEAAAKKFANEEFYNRNLMSVGIGGKDNQYELIVHLFKKIRTDNLPQEYDGLKVSYKFVGKVIPA
jgi:hypothetical protein